MKKNHRRRFCGLALLIATAAFEIEVSQARADWGWGGFGAFNYVPQPGDFLNQRSLLNAGNATQGRVSNNVYANNPNAYFNRMRDSGFVPHQSVLSRGSPAYEAPRRRSPTVTQTSNNQPAAAPATASVPRPVVPIGSFFDASRTLVWPSDAPVAGELQVKRDTSDQACLVVSDLVDKHGSAPITTVTSARQKLLDYGQPALQVMRSHTTPRIAETFHQFLLSLYESLAQAGDPPEVASASKPAP